jgi:hypothetical protein
MEGATIQGGTIVRGTIVADQVFVSRNTGPLTDRTASVNSLHLLAAQAVRRLFIPHWADTTDDGRK